MYVMKEKSIYRKLLFLLQIIDNAQIVGKLAETIIDLKKKVESLEVE